jgi:hypothetical protein
MTENVPATAAQSLAKVQEIAKTIKANDLLGRKLFVDIGLELLNVQTSGDWKYVGESKEGSFQPYSSFSLYVRSLEKETGKRRTQLYNYLAIAKDVLPYVLEKDLVEIGITKANLLRKMLKAGHSVTPLVLHAAKTESEGDLKSTIAEQTGVYLLPPEKDECWTDLGAIIATPAKRQSILETFNHALKEVGFRDIVLHEWKDFEDLAPATKGEVLDMIFADYRICSLG